MRALAIALTLLIVLAYAGGKFYLYHKTSKGMETAIMAASPFMTVKYGGISSSFTGKLSIDDLVIQIHGFKDDIAINKLGIDTPNIIALFELGKLATGSSAGAGKLPEYLGLYAEDVLIESNADYYRKFFDESMKAAGARDRQKPGVDCTGKYGLFSPKALSAMEYETQVFSILMTVRPGASDFTIDMNTDIDDMFDMAISVVLGGNMMGELSKGQAYRPKLSQLSIDYTDRSLLSRIDKYCAQLGLTPEETLASHMDSLKYFGKVNGIVFDEYIINPYKEYLGGKPNLVITAKPRRLIDFNEISHYNPKDVPALLNLEAVA